MASERQIAANRRNARQSTGPRSGAGKNRASRNAYRHGLTLSITSTAAFAKQLDKLVRKIAGNTENAIVLERARAIAQAELDLARVRRAKVAVLSMNWECHLQSGTSRRASGSLRGFQTSAQYMHRRTTRHLPIFLMQLRMSDTKSAVSKVARQYSRSAPLDAFAG